MVWLISMCNSWNEDMEDVKDFMVFFIDKDKFKVSLKNFW